jgi:glycosyltransferase involved in cell wall biosynthesis
MTEIFQNLSNNHRKIRVAHLINFLVPAGKEMGITKLLTHMDNSLFDNILVVFSTARYNLDPKEFNHLNIVYLNKKDGNDISLPFRLASFFHKWKPDIVHTHSWGTLIEGIIGAKLGRVPLIIHGEHGTFPETAPHRYFQKIFWNMSDVVLSVSGILKEKLSKTVNFSPEKIHVILNGVDTGKFYPSKELREEFRSRYDFPPDSFVVGTVGRLNPVKNYQMLIKAASEVIQKGEIIEVVFVGDGEKREELESLAKELNIQKHIHFMGYQKEINLFLNGMDTFALTSVSEGCSNVIQEALFTGTPVVATNVGGNPELVKPDLNGYLVESNDFKMLAEKILLLKKQPELRKHLAENALTFAKENFSLKGMVDQYSELYVRTYQEKASRK